jgi:hypothetical protein
MEVEKEVGRRCAVQDSELLELAPGWRRRRAELHLHLLKAWERWHFEKFVILLRLAQFVAWVEWLGDSPRDSFWGGLSFFMFCGFGQRPRCCSMARRRCEI